MFSSVPLFLVATALGGIQTQQPLTIDTAPRVHWTCPTPTIRLFNGSRDFVKQPFRIALVLIEFADVKHDPVHTPLFYRTYYFADRTYLRTPSGASSPGSVADFYAVQSHHTFKLTGTAFDWVAIPSTKDSFKDKKSGDREARERLFSAAIDAVKKRDGAGALEGFDAFGFIYAGSIRGMHQGDLLWSHESRLAGSRETYLITSEIEKINVSCHEFGHVLGLPDLYQRKNKDGKIAREGLGAWSTMANGYQSDKPHHLDCWCKMQLGWLTPTALQPGEPTDYLLRPIEANPQDSFVIAAGDDQYYMLENREQLGLDESLAPGLYICRCTVTRNGAGGASTALHLAGPRDESPDDQNVRRRFAWPDGNKDTFVGPGFVLRNIHADGANVAFTLEKQ